MPGYRELFITILVEIFFRKPDILYAVGIKYVSKNIGRRIRRNMHKMNSLREEFNKVAKFQKFTHLPHFEGMAFWGETITRWYGEGLPEDTTPWEFFQLDRFMDNAPKEISYHTDRVVSPPYWPPLQNEIVEETESYVIQREDDGIIKKQLKNGVSMPYFIRFPVENRRNWEEMKVLLNPEDEQRYSSTVKIAPSLKNRDFILRFGLCGGYGFQRNLFGEEKLCYVYYDDPCLIHDIMKHWVYLYSTIADHLCPLIDFDYVFLWEDMAYKTSSLISPSHFREFILPYYKELIRYLHERYSLDLFMVDSDGNNFSLLPLFIEGGVNMFTPLEISAGMEPLVIREQFPYLALLGGIDKRVLLKSKKEIEEEIMRKVPQMLRIGGYFPSLDHHVPSDISFENFCYYIEYIREVENTAL